MKIPQPDQNCKPNNTTGLSGTDSFREFIEQVRAARDIVEVIGDDITLPKVLSTDFPGVLPVTTITPPVEACDD